MKRLLLTGMQHRCPQCFRLLRTAWWLVRHRRFPPTYKPSSEFDYPRYRLAMEQELLRASRRRKVKNSYAVVIKAQDAGAAAIRQTLHALVRLQLRPQKVLVCGVLEPSWVCEYEAVFAISGCPDLAASIASADEDILLFVKAGSALRPHAANLLLDAFGNQALACLIHADFEERCASGERRLALSQGTSINMLPLLAWHQQRTLSAGSLLQGLIENDWAHSTVFHLPAVLSETDPQREAADRSPQLATALASDALHNVATRPSLSVVIPTRDGGAVLRDCVDAVCRELQQFGADNELIVVDNGSREPLTLSILRDLQAQYPELLRVVEYDHPFNYSAINNWAVEQTAGELLLLLNDDIKPQQSGWLMAMYCELVKPEVGVVGARLLYPDRTVQHAGVAMGLGGVAGHPGRGLALHNPRWRYWPHDQVKPVCAVTGACLLTSRQVYLSLQGLNAKDLSVAFNDVDFCLRARAAGWKVVYTPAATLIHFESLSRGAEDTAAKQRRFSEEIRYMRSQWQKLIANDPYYSPHLSDHLDDLSFRVPTAQSLLILRSCTDERIRDS